MNSDAYLMTIEHTFSELNSRDIQSHYSKSQTFHLRDFLHLELYLKVLILNIPHNCSS